VIADHIRATSFLVADGVIPSNEGRGYVQRRIIRRAIRHGYKLGQKTPFFHKLVPDLVKLMGEAYPHLKAAEKRVMDTLKAEEERFYETLANGMEILDSGAGRRPEGAARRRRLQAARHLRLPARPVGRRLPRARRDVDEAGFNAAMEKQKAAGRAAGKFKMDRALEYAGAGNVFTGYERLEEQAKVARAVLRRHAGAAAEGRPAGHRGAGHHAVLFRERRPGRRQRRAGGRGRAVRRGGHAEDQGRRVRPPRHADAGHAEGGRHGQGRGRHGAPRRRPCATTASRT
jgi:alanyl-tRNA synthetase